MIVMSNPPNNPYYRGSSENESYPHILMVQSSGSYLYDLHFSCVINEYYSLVIWLLTLFHLYLPHQRHMCYWIYSYYPHTFFAFWSFPHTLLFCIIHLGYHRIEPFVSFHIVIYGWLIVLSTPSRDRHTQQITPIRIHH